MKVAILIVLAGALAYCVWGLLGTFEAGAAGAGGAGGAGGGASAAGGGLWKLRAIYAAGVLVSVGLLIRTTIALVRQIVLLVVAAAIAYYWFFLRQV